MAGLIRLWEGGHSGTDCCLDAIAGAAAARRCGHAAVAGSRRAPGQGHPDDAGELLNQYVGGADDGVIDADGVPVGAAVCSEFMRTQTASGCATGSI